AGNIVADGDGAFLAVGNRAHARGRDSLGGQIIAHGLSAAGAERDVVFARAAFVRVSFDREGVAIVELQPLGLLVQGRARLRRELRRIGFEEDPVADVDDKVLLTARCGGAGQVGVLLGRLIGTASNRKCRREKDCELRSAENTLHHAGASISRRYRIVRSKGGSLNERSIYLDDALPTPLENARTG